MRFFKYFKIITIAAMLIGCVTSPETEKSIETPIVDSIPEPKYQTIEIGSLTFLKCVDPKLEINIDHRNNFTFQSYDSLSKKIENISEGHCRIPVGQSIKRFSVTIKTKFDIFVWNFSRYPHQLDSIKSIYNVDDLAIASIDSLRYMTNYDIKDRVSYGNSSSDYFDVKTNSIVLSKRNPWLGIISIDIER